MTGVKYSPSLWITISTLLLLIVPVRHVTLAHNPEVHTKEEVIRASSAEQSSEGKAEAQLGAGMRERTAEGDGTREETREEDLQIQFTAASCPVAVQSRSVKVDFNADKLRAIFIRQGVPGRIEIRADVSVRDDSRRHDVINVDVVSKASNDDALDDILFHHSVLDSNIGPVLVLQVTSRPRSSSALLLGAALASALFLVVVGTGGGAALCVSVFRRRQTPGRVGGGGGRGGEIGGGGGVGPSGLSSSSSSSRRSRARLSSANYREGERDGGGGGGEVEIYGVVTSGSREGHDQEDGPRIGHRFQSPPPPPPLGNSLSRSAHSPDRSDDLELQPSISKQRHGAATMSRKLNQSTFPDRGDRITDPRYDTLPSSRYSSVASRGGGRNGGVRGGKSSDRASNRLHRVTLLICALTAVLSATVYAAVDPDCSGFWWSSSADLVIWLPRNTAIEEVRLFVADGLQSNWSASPVVMDMWSRAPLTRLHVFDVDDLTTMHVASCDVTKVCPFDALQQGLAACDPPTQSCICPRGYVIDSVTNLCIDRDECRLKVHRCPADSTCRNTNGSYVCNCPTGYYHNGYLCTACSTGCPEDDQYQSTPCGDSHDQICSACDKCTGSMYESRPCRHLSNRQCIHAAHPLLLTANNASLRNLLKDLQRPVPVNQRRKRLRVESFGGKLFLENQHKTTTLETTYYVTDATQQTDFFWYRNNSIRINIGLQNIHLIPVYRDVDHDSDNAFVANNPSSAEEQEQFKNILANHCRNPVPDQYVVTMEIAKDRTTQASIEVCNADMSRSGQCPEHVAPGDTFIHRSINEPCRSSGSYPEALKPVSNSVVCTDSTELMTQLFNITPSIVRPISFPSKECRLSISHCDHCLEQEKCLVDDLFRRQCCQVDCYSMPDCKLARSAPCHNAPVDCAMGDAYRFTLKPIFANLRHEFRCHVRHVRPTVLYQLWFYITVPEVGFETPRQHVTVASGDVISINSGRYVTRFLTIDHNAGLQGATDDLLVVGKYWQMEQTAWKWNYTVHPIRPRSADISTGTGAGGGGKRTPAIHSISNDIHVLTTQFDEPFAYSTSSWVRGNDCRKDITRFRPTQRLHHSGAGPAASGGHHATSSRISSPGSSSSSSSFSGAHEVNVITLTDDRKAFEYWVKSLANPPHMKFIIPANTSVLRWWFHDKPSALIVDTLQTSLDLSADERTWLVNISGGMTQCPGYLSISISDRVEREELFKYDVLVPCLARFNLTFFIPTLGVKQSKTFEIIIDDSKSVSRSFLTFFANDVGTSSSTTSSIWRYSTTATRAEASASAAAASATLEPHIEDSESMGVYVTIFISLVSLFVIIVLTSLYVSLSARSDDTKAEPKETSDVGAIPYDQQLPGEVGTAMEGENDQEEEEEEAEGEEGSGVGSGEEPPSAEPRRCVRELSPSSRQRQRTFVISLYVIARILYSVAFTFTTTITFIAPLVVRHDVEYITQKYGYTQKRYTHELASLHGGVSAQAAGRCQVNDATEKLEAYFTVETERRATLVSRMAAACDQYTDDVIQTILADVERYDGWLSDDAGMTTIMTWAVNQTLSRYRERLSTYRRGYETSAIKRAGRTIEKYRSYLRKVYANGWLSYAQFLYNTTTSPADFSPISSLSSHSHSVSSSSSWVGSSTGLLNRRSEAIEEDARLDGPDLDFVAFLLVQPASDVQEWLPEFLEKSDAMFKSLVASTSVALRHFLHSSSSATCSSAASPLPLLSASCSKCRKTGPLSNLSLHDTRKLLQANLTRFIFRPAYDADLVSDPQSYVAGKYHKPDNDGSVSPKQMRKELEKDTAQDYNEIPAVDPHIFDDGTPEAKRSIVEHIIENQTTRRWWNLFTTNPTLTWSHLCAIMYAFDVALLLHRLINLYNIVQRLRSSNSRSRAAGRWGNAAAAPLPSVHRRLESERRARQVESVRKWYEAAMQLTPLYETNITDDEPVESSDHELEHHLPLQLYNTNATTNNTHLQNIEHELSLKKPNCNGTSRASNMDNGPIGYSSAVGHVMSDTVIDDLGGDLRVGSASWSQCCLEMFFQTDVVPRLVFTAVCALLAILVMMSAHKLIHCDVLFALNGLSRLRETWQHKVTILTDDLETISSQNDAFFDDVYRRHVTFELSHLAAVDELFVIARTKRVHTDKIHRCLLMRSLRDVTTNVTSSCQHLGDPMEDDRDTGLHRLPVVPCNFMSARGRLLESAVTHQSQWEELAENFTSTCQSSRRLVVSLSNLVLLLLASLVVCHLLDLIFRRASLNSRLFTQVTLEPGGSPGCRGRQGCGTLRFNNTRTTYLYETAPTADSSRDTSPVHAMDCSAVDSQSSNYDSTYVSSCANHVLPGNGGCGSGGCIVSGCGVGAYDSLRKLPRIVVGTPSFPFNECGTGRCGSYDCCVTEKPGQCCCSTPFPPPPPPLNSVTSLCKLDDEELAKFAETNV